MSASYRIFDITLKSKTLISPSLVRCVFEGADIHRMKLEAPDQRIKLLFPAADGKIPQLVNGPDWYGDYMAIPKEQRPVMRTYTLRALRREQNQMDVEFVLHGVNGPASAWATHAEPGDALQTVAPNADFDGDSGGYEWVPPAQLQQALLIADETAVPAAMGILEQLAQQANPPRVQAFLRCRWRGIVWIWPVSRSPRFTGCRVTWATNWRMARCWWRRCASGSISPRRRVRRRSPWWKAA